MTVHNMKMAVMAMPILMLLVLLLHILMVMATVAADGELDMSAFDKF